MKGKMEDEEGCDFVGVGYGQIINEALKDTIEYFFNMINENISEEIFECSDSFNFYVYKRTFNCGYTYNALKKVKQRPTLMMRMGI